MDADLVGVVEWAVGLFVTGSGLTAAPWVTALLRGNLRPHSWVVEQLKDKDAQISAWIEAAAIQQKRADNLATQLAEVAQESAAAARHLLEALPRGEDDPTQRPHQ